MSHPRDFNLIDLEGGLAIRSLQKHLSDSKVQLRWWINDFSWGLQGKVWGSDTFSSLMTSCLDHYEITALFRMSSVCLTLNMTPMGWLITVPLPLILRTSTFESVAPKDTIWMTQDERFWSHLSITHTKNLGVRYSLLGRNMQTKVK